VKKLFPKVCSNSIPPQKVKKGDLWCRFIFLINPKSGDKRYSIFRVSIDRCRNKKSM